MGPIKVVLSLILVVLCSTCGGNVYLKAFFPFRLASAVNSSVTTIPPKSSPLSVIGSYVQFLLPFRSALPGNLPLSTISMRPTTSDGNSSTIIMKSSIANVTENGKVPEKMMILTFVNGIYHSETEVRELAIYLRCMFRSDVRTFYNPSSGSWVKDAYKAGFELVLRPNDLILAKQLAEHLRSALREVHPQKGRVLHIAHSGGAIITYLAAKYHLTFAESSRIDVVTLGAGRSLTHKYFRGRLYNYYARNDPVLLVESRAAKLLKKTTNHTYSLVRDSKHNTTFVFLEAVAQDTIYDHAVDGPTYRQALGWEAREFQARLRQMMQSDAREKSYVRLARKRVARLTGVRHFWQRYSTPSVAYNAARRVRKFSANVTNIHGLWSGKPRLVNHFLSEKSMVNMFGSRNVSEVTAIPGHSSVSLSNSTSTNYTNPTTSTPLTALSFANNDTSVVEVEDAHTIGLNVSPDSRNTFCTDNSTDATLIPAEICHV